MRSTSVIDRCSGVMFHFLQKADSTISFDCVIGYVATVQISTVRNDNQQSTPIMQLSNFCHGSHFRNGRQVIRAAAVVMLSYKGCCRAGSEYLSSATNQQAKIAAAAVALESLTQPCRVRVF